MEVIPIKDMRLHSLELQEVFDEIDLKVAGAEIKGLVGVFKSVKRWFCKDYPALQAFTGKSGLDGQMSETVRLTCTYRRHWLARRLPSRKETEDCISVLAESAAN